MKYENVERSQFSNTYGGLSIVKGSDGLMYLEMGDCSGADYFGPLAEDEIKAFYLLCKLGCVQTGVQG